MQPARRQPVADVALSGRVTIPAEAITRIKALDRLRLGDTIFRHLTRGAAITVLLLLSGVIISLIDGSIPAIQDFRLRLSDKPAVESGYR